jgi:hypothetical protein
MAHRLTWQTTPGLRGFVCSKFRIADKSALDNQQGIAVSLDRDDAREGLIAELEMHFAAQRFETADAAFEAVKTYALERAGGKRKL